MDERDDASTSENSAHEADGKRRRLVDPFISHGGACRCRTRTYVAELSLPTMIKVSIGQTLQSNPNSLTIGMAMKEYVELDDRLADALLEALERWASLGCPYSGGSFPSTPWNPQPSSRIEPNFDSIGDDWPDDWDGEDWTRWRRRFIVESEVWAELLPLPTLRAMSSQNQSGLMALIESHWWLRGHGTDDEQ